jgi:hypothetical protein
MKTRARGDVILEGDTSYRKPYRNKYIYRLHRLDHLTLKELSARFNVSPARVRDIISQQQRMENYRSMNARPHLLIPHRIHEAMRREYLNERLETGKE